MAVSGAAGISLRAKAIFTARSVSVMYDRIAISVSRKTLDHSG